MSGSERLSGVLHELEARDLVAQISDRDALTDHLAGGSRTVYCGFDPTADSLHVGNLIPLFALARFQRAGHRPIVLIGGATGLIGDPSFKSTERVLNEPEVVASWVGKIRKQVSKFVDLEGNNAALVVDNLDWTRELDVITFLRDIGKHFSVNAMMQKESVRERLTQENVGLSFTEFSYMILQAMDFMELARRHGCTVQLGGSDQWGNITAGLDLVRRMLRQESFALTLRLLTKSDGTKFGKTEAGSIWLDADKTSPYAFHQFWLNSPDAGVDHLLKYFTFLDVGEIDDIERATRQAPEKRAAQRRLADEVTRLVHGESALDSVTRISRALFSDELRIRELTQHDLQQLERDGLPVTPIRSNDQQTGEQEGEQTVAAFIADAQLAPSRGAARKLLQSKGITINGEIVTNEAALLTRANALFGRYHLVRRGKKHWHLGVHRTRAD